MLKKASSWSFEELGKKERIDNLLVENGIAENLAKARAFVMAGVVLVDEQRIDKPSQLVSPEESIRIKGDNPENRYASRAGLKIEKALAEFDVDPSGFTCLDVGSSTGGFTDCLLGKGAESVVCLDVGTNQLIWRLRTDPRVLVMEQTNARYVTREDFEHEFDLITVDVSFISLKKLLENLKPLLKERGRIITLIKPQFEVGKSEIGKGGIVRNPELHKEVIEKIEAYAYSIGLESMGIVESPIFGASGNKEFLAAYKIAETKSDNSGS